MTKTNSGNSMSSRYMISLYLQARGQRQATMVRSKNVLQPLIVDEQNQSSQYQQRRGPKTKRIGDRQLNSQDLKLIQRPKHVWSQRQKIRVFVFLYHYRIPISNLPFKPSTCQYRAPIQQAASKIFYVPQ